MKQFKHLVSLVMVLSLALVFIGCSKPPEAEQQAAKTAMGAAVAAGADIYAAADLDAAKKLWTARKPGEGQEVQRRPKKVTSPPRPPSRRPPPV
jgi:PBP1b-binding outer membrane lipoprotein LpoB